MDENGIVKLPLHWLIIEEAANPQAVWVSRPAIMIVSTTMSPDLIASFGQGQFSGRADLSGCPGQKTIGFPLLH